MAKKNILPQCVAETTKGTRCLHRVSDKKDEFCKTHLACLKRGRAVERYTGSTSTGSGWWLSAIFDLRTIALTLAVLSIYAAERFEMAELGVPKLVALSWLDVASLAIGNILPILMTLTSVVLILAGLLALIFVAVLVLYIVSPNLPNIAFEWMRYAKERVRIWWNKISSFVIGGASEAGTSPTLEFRAILATQLSNAHQRRVTRTGSEFANLADRWKRARSTCVRWSMALVEILFASGRKGNLTYAARFAFVFVLAGGVVWSSWLVANNHNQRVAVELRRMMLAEHFLHKQEPVPFAGECPLDERISGKTISGVITLAASHVHPVTAGQLVLNERHPMASSYLESAFGEDTSATSVLSKKVFYIGDYGDWALIAPVDGYADPGSLCDTESGPPLGKRVLIRRSAILEFTTAEASKPKDRKSDVEPDLKLQSPDTRTSSLDHLFDPVVGPLRAGSWRDAALRQAAELTGQLKALSEQLLSVEEKIVSGNDAHRLRIAGLQSSLARMRSKLSNSASTHERTPDRRAFVEPVLLRLASELNALKSKIEDNATCQLCANHNEQKRQLSLITSRLDRALAERQALAHSLAIKPDEQDVDALSERISNADQSIAHVQGQLSIVHPGLVNTADRETVKALSGEIDRAVAAGEVLTQSMSKLEDTMTETQKSIPEIVKSIISIEMARPLELAESERQVLEERIGDVDNRAEFAAISRSVDDLRRWIFKLRETAENRERSQIAASFLREIERFSTHLDQAAKERKTLDTSIEDLSTQLKEFKRSNSGATDRTAISEGADFARAMRTGLPIRVANVFHAFQGTSRFEDLKSCIEDRSNPIYVDFGTGQSSLPNGLPGAAERSIVSRLSLRDIKYAAADSTSNKAQQDQTYDFPERFVFVRGGASSDGPSDVNLALSERRADWVARQIKKLAINELRDNSYRSNQNLRQHGLEIVAFGTGEALGIFTKDETVSSRAVEIVICPN